VKGWKKRKNTLDPRGRISGKGFYLRTGGGDDKILKKCRIWN